MIRHFKDRETRKIWAGTISRKLPTDIQAIARRKLRMPNNARLLKDLSVPPAHRLEVLKGAQNWQHSIRINDQWRICFVWRNGNADEVEIVHGKRALSADTAMRLVQALGTSEQFWMGLQADYDLEEAWISSGNELKKIENVAA